MELNDQEVSGYSRSHTDKQLNSDILITFFNEARTPANTENSPEKSGQ